MEKAGTGDALARRGAVGYRSGSLARSGSSLRSGDMMGSYQMLVPIGAGGMGRVWVARETRIIPGTGKWRLVAVKTALAEDNASHEFFRTLFDEARIASLLTHPNVCTIHVVEKERGVDY